HRPVDATSRGHVLTLLARLNQDLRAPTRRHLRDFVTSGDYQKVVTARSRLHRALSVTARQRPPGPGAHGGPQALLGGVEIFDQADDPRRHQNFMTIACGSWAGSASRPARGRAA